MSAYIKGLFGEIAGGECSERRSANLADRLQSWHRSLPPVARSRPYAMTELECALKVPGRLLSRALIDAGWTRKRRWDGSLHYYRYWVPPKC